MFEFERYALCLALSIFLKVRSTENRFFSSFHWRSNSERVSL